jgi:hypothetical protein
MVVVFTALSLAVAYGWLAGFVRQANGGLSFEWQWPIAPWALGGAASAIYFWRKIWPLPNQPDATRKDVVKGFVVLLVPGLWWLVLPLRSFSGQHFWDVVKGLTAAIIVLSFGAWMVIHLGKSFERVDAEDLERENERENRDSGAANQKDSKE